MEQYKIAEYTFFSGAHGIFFITNSMLGHKTSLEGRKEESKVSSLEVFNFC